MESSRRGTVIVAEGRGPVRDYVQGLLSRALPEVSQVSASGCVAAREVIDSLASLSSASGPIVVVSGVRSSGIDGLDLAEHVWRSGSPVSVVLLCGFPTVEERARARELAATLIEDPIGFGRLAEIVEALLGAPQPTLH